MLSGSNRHKGNASLGTEKTPYVINLADLAVGWTDADGDRLNSNNWYVDHGWSASAATTATATAR